ncbi:MAG: hypothetical protein QOE96_3104 [Blastocatellia bacterium]|nr:hypothetical protein [Blastocatellia bacterium]
MTGLTRLAEYRDHGDDLPGKIKHLDTVARYTADYRQHLYNLMEVTEGDAVLDLGCGPGTSATLVGRLVGPEGRLVAVDKDSAVLAVARQRAEEAALTERLACVVSDGTALPFVGDSFDVCYSENVFMHLEDPERVLAELLRVTRPGGRILIRDIDHATLSIGLPEAELERKVAACWAAKHANPYAGRKLLGSLTRLGMSNLSVHLKAFRLGKDLNVALYLLQLDDVLDEGVAAGRLTPEESARFREALEQASDSGQVYATMTAVAVTGCKPSATP